VKVLLNWTIFAAILAGAWSLAGPTSLGGPASYVIVDGRSMEPTYQDGDLVIARTRDSYDIGDVIVYRAPVDATGDVNFEVIHRVIDRTEEGYVTQGDNRDRPDGWIAFEDSIHGTAVAHIPSGGAAVAFLRQPAAILGLLAGFLTFEHLKRSERKSRASRTDSTCQEAT
jgi:signal peptidase I